MERDVTAFFMTGREEPDLFRLTDSMLENKKKINDENDSSDVVVHILLHSRVRCIGDVSLKKQLFERNNFYF